METSKDLEIKLQANGQALEIVSKPPVVASGIIHYLRFLCDLSQEWQGYERYFVLCRNAGAVRAHAIVDGVAYIENEPLDTWGTLEVAIMAEREGARLTTESVTVPIKKGA